MKKLVKLFLALTFLGATGIFYGCGDTSSQAQVFDTKETDSPKETGIVTEETATDTKENAKQEPSNTTTAEVICVYVCGQVKKPGVYTVTPGARVNDVVTMAGGMTKKASLESVNLAKTVADEEQIYIPSKEEADKGTVAGAAGNGEAESEPDKASGKININTASKEELMSLSGIGESKAESILSYRKANGSFSSIEDIMKIDGIKEGVFNKIKENITV